MLKKSQKEILRRLSMEHRSLSPKSLEDICDWVERNRGNDLAEAFYDSGLMIGCGWGIFEALRELYPEKDLCSIRYEARLADSLAFVLRDTVGRLILDYLRSSERKNKRRVRDE